MTNVIFGHFQYKKYYFIFFLIHINFHFFISYYPYLQICYCPQSLYVKKVIRYNTFNIMTGYQMLKTAKYKELMRVCNNTSAQVTYKG